LKGAMFYR